MKAWPSVTLLPAVPCAELITAVSDKGLVIAATMLLLFGKVLGVLVVPLFVTELVTVFAEHSGRSIEMPEI